MSNRITARVAVYQARLDQLNGVGLNGTPISELEQKQALSFEEFVGFQNAQSQAYARGVLNTDEAQTVYRLLGGEVYHGDWPVGTSLAQKLVITKLMGELLLPVRARV